ncbi:Excinuclease ABC subunit C [hydrothermal vent metagenome]|uniref:UvrABC system protein C n=1 Tax=hydrothermal vent metagenome TaxID=652676 RepID=A0A3B0Y3F9_9ZZZZ
MDNSKNPPDFDAQSFLRTLTTRPGVYRMFGIGDDLLYVGKAKNLKNRVSSYFRKSGLPIKTQAMMRQMVGVEVTVTHTEAEALILENTLIKTHRPRYNILLRDDKSYPYIFLSSEDLYPRLSLHRGARRRKGRYFGPYPSAGSVRESLHLLQKTFRVRQCEDSFFSNRSRPCLQYQIKRCTAPCVGFIDAQRYAEDVMHTVQFLEGGSSALREELAGKMDAAAQSLDYESAAICRDQIASLSRVQERQYVAGETGDLDILACAVDAGVACVQVFFIRQGVNLGSRLFFPKNPRNSEAEAVLSAFIPQYYLARQIPAKLLTSCEIGDAVLFEQVLGERAERRVHIIHRVRGERARWLKMGVTNAEQALTAHLASRAGVQQRLQLLKAALELEDLPRRMECFDISHTQGEGTVASCVVFDSEGPRKSDYRRFNIRGVQAGDDYAAMEQALTRRYTRLKTEESQLPDILFIDGGKGQVAVAERVLMELQIDEVLIVGVAKGAERRAGMEILHIPAQARQLDLDSSAPALHLIQQIRDEAHRFAITGHRQQRARARKTSALESVPGIGPHRRQRLLKQFGGLQEVARAGVEDLCKVPGISRTLAEQIYDTFHGDP